MVKEKYNEELGKEELELIKKYNLSDNQVAQLILSSFCCGCTLKDAIINVYGKNNK